MEQVAQKAAEAKAVVAVQAAEQVAAESSPQRATGIRRGISGRQQLGSDSLPISGGARPIVPKQHAKRRGRTFRWPK